MSDDGVNRLRELQAQLAADAARVTTKADLLRLRMYWGDLQQVIDNETNGE